ncbi:T32E20.16 [Arabidopsis thaliana]|uniref:T32E20.16 n=1 Tax=Arabidopsis thaliana TaxID=3702 RepID=Q9LPA4_ARATH|nr:T32E20.16 [Arabidopsis thaliana]
MVTLVYQFQSILVHGPEYLRRSLDVFLQSLIHELQTLWSEGVVAYDTINNFPAYGMLYGWTTHGRLSCPYYQDTINAFQLKHGKKSCWFDCHRRSSNRQKVKQGYSTAQSVARQLGGRVSGRVTVKNCRN